MSIQRSSALLLVRLSQITAQPPVWRYRAPKLFPCQVRRRLTTADPSETASPTSSSSTESKFAGSDWTARHKRKPRFPDPDPSLPIVEYETVNGTWRRNVKVSAKTNTKTLTAALSPLISAHASRQKGLGETRSVGSGWWTLEKDAATIIRYFAFRSEPEATKFTDSVRAAADEMDHHPQIHTIADRVRTNVPLRFVAISCTTHRPPGLSMRDMRLARKIDELAGSFNHFATHPDHGSSALRGIRQELVQGLRTQKDGSDSPITGGT